MQKNPSRVPPDYFHNKIESLATKTLNDNLLLSTLDPENPSSLTQPSKACEGLTPNIAGRAGQTEPHKQSDTPAPPPPPITPSKTKKPKKPLDYTCKWCNVIGHREYVCDKLPKEVTVAQLEKKGLCVKCLSSFAPPYSQHVCKVPTRNAGKFLDEAYLSCRDCGRHRFKICQCPDAATKHKRKPKN